MLLQSNTEENFHGQPNDLGLEPQPFRVANLLLSLQLLLSCLSINVVLSAVDSAFRAPAPCSLVPSASDPEWQVQPRVLSSPSLLQAAQHR